MLSSSTCGAKSDAHNHSSSSSTIPAGFSASPPRRSVATAQTHHHSTRRVIKLGPPDRWKNTSCRNNSANTHEPHLHSEPCSLLPMPPVLAATAFVVQQCTSTTTPAMTTTKKTTSITTKAVVLHLLNCTRGLLCSLRSHNHGNGTTVSFTGIPSADKRTQQLVTRTIRSCARRSASRSRVIVTSEPYSDCRSVDSRVAASAIVGRCAGEATTQ